MKSSFGKIITVFFFFIFFLLVFRSPAYAVEQQTQRWVCLLAEHCWKDPNSCSTAHKGNGHVAKLSAKPGFEPIPGIQTYVAVCIATGSDWLCSTGNAAADMQVYGKSNYDTLKSSYGFNFEGLFKADGTSTVTNPAVWSGPYEWGDSLPQSHAHQWQAMNYYDPATFAAGEGGGQQQGSFDFEAAEKKCVSINWDPYGRVFDAGTLEPITGVTVRLMIKKSGQFVQMTAGDVLGGNLTNPQTTQEDGNFSFLVPDGDYKLEVAPLTFVPDVAQVDINYKKAYFDIYPALTGDVIQQRGSLQHRDIPVTTVGTSTAPKMMEYATEADSNGGVTIQGRVSHPFSKLIAGTSKISATDPNNKTPYRTVGTFSADKWGRFDITLDQSKFEKTPDYIEVFSSLEIQKVDLRANQQVRLEKDNLFAQLLRTLMNIFQPVVTQAQTKLAITRFEPIPQFLDGYAYDASGKPIPNATVGVYLTISNKPYTQTKADATGHFIFRPSVLPNYSYVIKYTTPTGQVVQSSTSKFLAQNQKYIVQTKMNPFVVEDRNNQAELTKYPQLVAAASTGGVASSAAAGQNSSGSGRSSSQSSRSTTGGGSGAGGSQKSTSSVSAVSNPMSTTNPMIIITLLFILLLGGVAVGVLLYMKNKQQAAPPQW